jgi:hypothetical protein
MYSSSLASASPARRTQAVGQEDGHRVVIGLGKVFARRRSHNVGLSTTAPKAVRNSRSDCFVLWYL